MFSLRPSTRSLPQILTADARQTIGEFRDSHRGFAVSANALNDLDVGFRAHKPASAPNRKILAPLEDFRPIQTRTFTLFFLQKHATFRAISR